MTGEAVKDKVKGKQIQYFQKFLKTVIVPFGEYFGSEAEAYEEFTISLVSKKVYLKISELIINENNIILNKNKELADAFIYKYYTLKRYVDNGAYNEKNAKAFINEMVSSLFSKDFIQLIREYVEENYTINIGDEYNDEKKKFEEGITFLDRHYKVLYMISSMTRFIIPLCMQYIHTYPETNATEFLTAAFTTLFSVAQINGETDVYTKLSVFVERKVQKTLYTDSYMWAKIATHGITPKNKIESILNRLIIDVMPKYSFLDNIMSLNSVVIRKAIIEYTMRKKEPYKSYRLSDVDSSQSDDESVISEAEIFDSYNNKRNEQTIFIRKFYVDDTIEKIMVRNDINISPQEFVFYHENNKFHEFQKFAIFQSFASYFGGAENIYANNKAAYIKLMIILTKMLDKFGVPEMNKYITGTHTYFTYKRISKSIETALYEDERYKFLREVKYRSINGVFERKDFIKNYLVYLINNAFNHNMLDNPLNGTPIPKDEEEIKNGLLNFLTRMII